MGGTIAFSARDALAFLTSIIDTGLLSAATKVVSNALILVNAWLVPSGTILLILYGFAILFGTVQTSVRSFALVCLRFGIVCAALAGANYTTWVQNFSLTAIATDLGNLAQAGGTIGTDAHAFDIVANKAVVVGLVFWKSLSEFNPLKLLVVPFWIAAAVAVIFGYGIWLLGHILAVIYICTGPIFVWMALFPALRPAFSAWVGCLMGSLILQALAIILTTVVIAAEGQMVNAIVGTLANDGPAMVGLLLAASIIYGLAGWFALKLPSVAASLCGGIHFAPFALQAATYGALSAVARQAAQSIGSRAVRSPALAREGLAPRFQSPPGPSLSRAGSSL